MMKSNEKFYPWHCYGIPLYYISFLYDSNEPDKETGD